MSLLLPDQCLVVVGMTAEAALLPQGTRIACAGGDPVRLERLLRAVPPPAAVLSFGIAGGLRPGLDAGTLVVGTSIVTETSRLPTHAAWAERLARATGAECGPVAASPAVVGSVAAKAALHARTGALAVDMESGVAAAFAALHGLPFAALRAVADPAGDALVPSAAVGLHPDGRPAPGRVLRSLLRRPGDLPGLLRIARQSRLALARLRLAVARSTA